MGKFLKRAAQGADVPHDKGTSNLETVVMPLPSKITLSMGQHIGAPAAPCVAKGDQVYVGSVVGKAGGFVSCDIHSGVSGTVSEITTITAPNGAVQTAVVITPDGKQEKDPAIAPPQVTDMKSFVDAVRASGLVGLGGAGFPTAVKLAPKNLDEIDTLLINGAECEPYITSDTRTMIDNADDVIYGAQLLQKYYTADRIVIGIEDNKPQCIKIMEEAGKGVPGFEVASLPALYPQGGEKVLIYNTTGEVVPEGKLPIDVGAIVINCTTLAVIAKYIRTGMPLVEKVVTVDGSAVKDPQNVIVPVGAPIQNVLDFVGLKCEPKKVLYGGPMMGTSVPSLEAPVMKNTNAILAFDAKDAEDPVPSACIRCGRCVAHCPFNLMPAAIEAAYNNKEPEKLKALKVNLCMECGCCSYSCPARRPLVQVNKLAKAMLNKYNAEQKAAAEKKAAKEKEKEAV